MKGTISIATGSIMAGRVLAGFVAAAIATGIGAAGAQEADEGADREITLRSEDGTVDIIGEFVEFDDNDYVIMTDLGELRISAARVRCEGDACPVFDITGADVIFAGSDTVGIGLMPLVLQGYAGALGAEATTTATGGAGGLLAELVGEDGFGDPIGSLLVTPTTTGDGFAALLDGSADLAMASRRIRPEEARALRDAGAGNMVDPENEHIFAIDSLVVIVHPRNEIETLSTAQLADIFAGVVTDWSEVGGPEAPIKVMTRPADSGTRAVFEDTVFDGSAVPAPADAMELSDNVAMAAAVNDDPTAIGFVSYAFQRGAKPMPLVNECGLVMEPTQFAARTEEYALERRLYLYARGDERSEETQDFLDFVSSPQADGVISKSGFIDLGIDRQPQPVESVRGQMLLNTEADPYEGGIMREMLGMMRGFDRLSTTFRFRTGSSRLDERGEIDLERLANYLEQEPEGSQVMFVGFTDEVGAFDSNRELSRDRAQQVMVELGDLAGERLSALNMSFDGFGEVAPSACNSSERGRRINRRVEVWIAAPDGE